TAAALLRAFQAEFGNWPAMVLQRQVRAFGTRIIPGVPNGAVFALGEPSAFGNGIPFDHVQDDSTRDSSLPHAHARHHGHASAGSGRTMT
ncbi:MAG: LarC family nickel insertion protein, partial [Desulfovibrio sp.]|nr:LarC family nickel insertion protein [Desulfovibrio sp.]